MARRRIAGTAALLWTALLAAVALPAPEGRVETGAAARYGAALRGRKTASGEVYTGKDLTAAHRSLPFGTRVRVTRTDDGRSVVVRINDRCSARNGYVIDLSEAAAAEIGLTGRTRVDLRVLEKEPGPAGAGGGPAAAGASGGEP